MKRGVLVLASNRRWWARLALVLTMAAVALQLQGAWPYRTALELWLGPSHADVVEVRLLYVREGAAYQGLRLYFPSGAPATVPLETELPSGRFEVRITLTGADGTSRQVTRTLNAPVEGRRRLVLDR